MLTFRKYLEHSSTEESEDSDMHIATEKDFSIRGCVKPGDIFYTRKISGLLHRENGPAIISEKQKRIYWFLNGQEPAGLCNVFGNDGEYYYPGNKSHSLIGLNDKEIWQCLEQDVRCCMVITRLTDKMKEYVIHEDPTLIAYIKKPSIEMQKYIIKKRPDLIGEIKDLDPELAKEYKDELNMSGIEV
jgi:hypothetical protein